MEVEVEILSFSCVFPVWVEIKDTGPEILFVDLLNKKVYNRQGIMVDEELANAVLKRLGMPKTVTIPDEIQAAMVKYKDKQIEVQKEKDAREI